MEVKNSVVNSFRISHIPPLRTKQNIALTAMGFARAPDMWCLSLHLALHEMRRIAPFSLFVREGKLSLYFLYKLSVETCPALAVLTSLTIRLSLFPFKK